MPKTGRRTGPSKADGTQVQPVLKLPGGVDVELPGSNADFRLGGSIVVGGSILFPDGTVGTTVSGEAAALASSNPTPRAGTVIVETDTGLFKIATGALAYADLEYANGGVLVADDPAELDLDTPVEGGPTTATLTDRMARNAFSHGSGQYYHSIYGTSSTSTLTQDQLVLSPVWLSAGTIDRIGVEVTTLQAGGTIRVGIFTDSGGLPSALIAESTSPVDASTTGVKDQVIAATIPVNDRYWLAAVAQGAAGIVIQGGAAIPTLPIPLGTTAVGGTTAFVSRIKPSVSGTLAAVSPLTGLNANGQGVRVRWHFRYA